MGISGALACSLANVSRPSLSGRERSERTTLMPPCGKALKTRVEAFDMFDFEQAIAGVFEHDLDQAGIGRIVFD